MTKLQKLPIGIQTFDDIRNDGYLYVDKTKYLIDLIDRGKVYFLSRPRRFGKSLTISTFDALFSGKKELFKGLAAEEFLERPDYRTYPVIKIDLSQVTTSEGLDGFRASLTRITKETAEDCCVEIPDKISPGDALRNLIRELYAKSGPLVVLIDEYDKPILDFLHEPRMAEEARAILRDFYTQIKSKDASIRFVFLTGISKFSKMGVFSAMNNLEDISMDKTYAAMLGYTEEELLENFSEHIDTAADGMKMSKEELIEKIRYYYDGFSFDGEVRLYNPFSTLRFLKNPEFNNYWFESGTPSFIARYMKDKKLTVEQFRGYEVSRDFAFAPGEIETATAASFLYQSGYLSLRPGVLDDFSLDYPNREVLTAMSSLLIGNIFGDNEDLNNARNRLRESLVNDNAPGVQSEFNKLLDKIPYDDYTKAAQSRAGYNGDAREWIYRSTLLSYIYGMGLDVEAELHNRKGRADMVVKFRGHIWVMELKMTKHYASATECATAALDQIKEKGYADAFDEAMLLGLAIDDNERQITAIEAEKKGSILND
ncbi:ATPase AAA [Synergistales bacterium]|nr:ATPase AAA [Synergistales bacterium]